MKMRIISKIFRFYQTIQRKPRFRSSHQMCSVKKVLRNFANVTGKHLYQSFFFNKVAGWGIFSYRIPPVAASEPRFYLNVIIKT